MELVFFWLFLLLPFAPVVVIAKDKDYTANIAAAYNAEIPDGWARYVFWQQPLDDEIVVYKRAQVPKALKTPVKITRAAKPRKASPLAAIYRASSEQYEGADDVCIIL